jgi:hypothetical protein
MVFIVVEFGCLSVCQFLLLCSEKKVIRVYAVSSDEEQDDTMIRQYKAESLFTLSNSYCKYNGTNNENSTQQQSTTT